MIPPDGKDELHAYIGGIVRNLGGVAFAVGSTQDHVHMIIGLKAIHAPAEVLREVKKSSSLWAAAPFGKFAWQEGYGAFSEGAERVEQIVDYITRQEEHHRTVSSADELMALLDEHGIPYDERFFE